jgi:hypothetical protein
MRKLGSRERPVSAADVLSEQRHWGSARVGKDGSRRVPGVTRVHPNTGKEYVADARIFWNSMSDSSNGFDAYAFTGHGAVMGEAGKRSSCKEAIRRRDDLSADAVEFIPFSIEASGVWGPAVRDVPLPRTRRPRH